MVMEVLEVTQVRRRRRHVRVSARSAVPGDLDAVRLGQRSPRLEAGNAAAPGEVLAAPVVKTLSGKAVIPDDSPYTTGGIGLLGTRPSEELMEEIDTLFMIGTHSPYTQHLPAPAR